MISPLYRRAWRNLTCGSVASSVVTRQSSWCLLCSILTPSTFGSTLPNSINKFLSTPSTNSRRRSSATEEALRQLEVLATAKPFTLSSFYTQFNNKVRYYKLPKNDNDLLKRFSILDDLAAMNMKIKKPRDTPQNTDRPTECPIKHYNFYLTKWYTVATSSFSPSLIFSCFMT